MELVIKRNKYESLLKWIKQNSIVMTSLSLAILSSMLVPVDRNYIQYFDIRTLSTLLSMLIIVSCYSEINFFEISAIKIVSIFKNTRSSILALVYVTFIGSMIIANDMALLTFLPLGYYLLKSTGKEKYMAFTFVMQNISANLGGMVTPFGNPQNLYLYTFFNISTAEFVKIMFLPFLLSILLITVICLSVKKESLVILNNSIGDFNRIKFGITNILFLIFVGIIFRVVPYFYGMVAILITVFLMDNKALKKTDFPLLLTFIGFFVFSGNLSRIEIINILFSKMLENNTLITGIISCQFISNVPSAILLSKFTSNYRDLLISVNLGGAGTLVASLASLITYREYLKHNPEKKMYYLKVFSLLNFGFLMLILLVLRLIKYI